MVLALLISAIHPLLGPNGGVLLYPGRVIVSFIPATLGGSYVTLFLPLIFAAMVADAAAEDGVAPWRAYGTAWLLAALIAPPLDHWRGELIGGRLVVHLAFWYPALLLQGGLCMWAYAHWRTAQRTRRVIHQAEAERIRDAQRLQAGRLMALQARVDPGLLFEVLTRIGEIHATDAAHADAMLGDLIVLLRAMLPSHSLAMSTVAHEAHLVDAWIRVAGRGAAAVHVLHQIVPQAVIEEPIAPMIVKPLTEAAMAASHQAGIPWSLQYALVGNRLQVALWPSVPGAVIGRPRTDVLESLRRRLAEVYGSSAVLQVHDAPAQWMLDLPRLAHAVT